MARHPNSVFLRHPMNPSHRKSCGAREIADKRRKLGIAGKTEELRLHPLIGRVATVFVPRAVVNKKPVARHPVGRSQHDHVGLPLVEALAHLIDGVEGSIAMIAGPMTRLVHWDRVWQNRPADEAASLRCA
jgi:hypothetical protein